MGSIVLDNVTIDFPVFDAGQSFRMSLFAGPVGGLIRKGENSRTIYVRALNGISLTVNEGDRLGLMGVNGAGKSTLLRVMAGIYQPVEGTVRTDGRISALFNTTLGMDADDTGIENIMHIGMCLGMTPAEVRSKTAKIAEFAELGDFIHLPVRTYSTGMQLRLAFSIATSIRPGILLLDEGLGAGDAGFAGKAAQRVEELIEQSSALVLASHSEALIAQMCTKAVLLEHGRIIAAGDVNSVVTEYAQNLAAAQ